MPALVKLKSEASITKVGDKVSNVAAAEETVTPSASVTETMTDC